jgi:hypothetical protein
MKRSQHSMPMTLGRMAYPSDLTDEQWALLEPLIPAIAEDVAYWVPHPARDCQRHPLRLAKRMPMAHAAS